MRIKFTKWNMINIIPAMSITHVVEDEYPYPFSHSWIAIIVLGIVLNIDVPWELPSFGTGAYGPHWSRKKKIWRWL
jgi:hypothetical protein